MEILRKIVNISCLVYGLFGFISIIQLGAFVPPIPLRPILFLIFFIAYIKYKGLKTFTFNKERLFLIWMITMILVGPYFMETWTNFSSIRFYYLHIEPIVYWTSILSFSFLIFSFFYLSISNKKWYLYVIFCMILAGIYFSLSNRLFYDWMILISTGVLFIYVRFKKDELFLKKEWTGKLFIFNGIAVIILLEHLAILISN